LARVAALAAERDLPILLVGAFARDLLFWHMHGIEPGRGTVDIDITIQMTDWNAYRSFGQILLDAGFENREQEHREKFVDTETGREMDLLPFGTISPDGQSIVWPEDNSSWSVVGIAEALAHSLCLSVAAGTASYRVPFVSVPGLVLLKMVAVADRPEKRFKRDGTDIGFVIGNYLAIGNRDRLRTPPHDDIMGRVRNDLDLATAQLLGRDIASVASASTRERLRDILAREIDSRSRCFLTRGLQGSHLGGNFTRARAAVTALAEGVAWPERHASEEAPC
jgi:predicted nucleotidyltransferase